MKRIVVLLCLLSVLWPGTAQTFIRSLPTSTNLTSATKVPVDDATYGTRAVTLQNLLASTATNATLLAAITNVVEDTATSLLANKLDTTNGTAVALSGSLTNVSVKGTLTYDLSDESRLTANLDYGIAIDVGLSSTTAKARIRSVSTLSDLVAIDPLTSDIFSYVKVLGRISAGDGGGGDFQRVLASSGTTNTGTLFASTANATYAWKRVPPLAYTPQMFGARGDGVTDDTVAIQAVIDWVVYTRNITTNASGASIYFPAGSYLVTSTLTINKPAVLQGEMVERSLGTTINGYPFVRSIESPTAGVRFVSGITNGDPVVNFTGYFDSDHNGRLFAIKNIAIIGNGLEGDGVSYNPTDSGYGLEFENVTVTKTGGAGFKFAPTSGNMSYAAIRMCSAIGCNGDGFYISGLQPTTVGVKFDSCYANACANYGFRVENIRNLTFLNCVEDNSKLDGWYLNITTSSTFINCVGEGRNFSDSYGGYPWRLANTSRSTFIDCKAYTGLNGGWYLDACAYNRFLGGETVQLKAVTAQQTGTAVTATSAAFSTSAIGQPFYRSVGGTLTLVGLITAIGSTNSMGLSVSATLNTSSTYGATNSGVLMGNHITLTANANHNEFDRHYFDVSKTVSDSGKNVFISDNVSTATPSAQNTTVTYSGSQTPTWTGASQYNFSGDLLLNNGEQYQIKDSTGTARSAVTTSTDAIMLGYSTGGLFINSNDIRLGLNPGTANISINSVGDASSGTQLRNANSLNQVARYWNGSASTAYSGAQRVSMDSTAPSASYYWNLGGTDRMRLKSDGTLYVGSAATPVATQPPTETLSYSSTTVTVTAGKGPNQSSVLTCTNNFTLSFSSVADNDGGTIWVHPASTNCTVTLSSPAYGPSGTTLTITGGTGSTNHTVLTWKATTVNSTNVIDVNAMNYYR